MKYIIYFLFISAGFITACSGNNDRKASTEKPDSTADTVTGSKADNAFTDETLQVVNESGFSQYAKSRSLQIDWNKFTNTQFWKEDSMLKAHFVPNKKYYDSYG